MRAGYASQALRPDIGTPRGTTPLAPSWNLFTGRTGLPRGKLSGKASPALAQLGIAVGRRDVPAGHGRLPICSFRARAAKLLAGRGVGLATGEGRKVQSGTLPPQMGEPPPHHFTNGTAPPGTIEITDPTLKWAALHRPPHQWPRQRGILPTPPPTRENSPEGRRRAFKYSAFKYRACQCGSDHSPQMPRRLHSSTPRRSGRCSTARSGAAAGRAGAPGPRTWPARSGCPPLSGASETKTPPRGSPPHGRCPPVGRKRISPPPPQAGTRNHGRTDGSHPGADPAIPRPPGRSGNTPSPSGTRRREDGPPHHTGTTWDGAPTPAPVDRTGARRTGQGEIPLNRDGHTWAKSDPATG